MNARLTRWIASVALAVPIVSATAPAHAEEAKKPFVKAAAELKWEDLVMVPGSKMAPIVGDPHKGAYSALKKIPMGVALPVHTHTYDQKVIMISGTIALAIEGGPLMELGPGSYAYIPGGTRHSANCHAGIDCIYFEEQPGLSDMKTVGVGSTRK